MSKRTAPPMETEEEICGWHEMLIIDMRAVIRSYLDPFSELMLNTVSKADRCEGKQKITTFRALISSIEIDSKTGCREMIDHWVPDQYIHEEKLRDGSSLKWLSIDIPSGALGGKIVMFDRNAHAYARPYGADENIVKLFLPLRKAINIAIGASGNLDWMELEAQFFKHMVVTTTHGNPGMILKYSYKLQTPRDKYSRYAVHTDPSGGRPFRFELIAKGICANNRIELFQSLFKGNLPELFYDYVNTCRVDEVLMIAAAETDHLPLFRWTFEQRGIQDVAPFEFRYDLFRYNLHDNRRVSEALETRNMVLALFERALISNSLSIVRWLVPRYIKNDALQFGLSADILPCIISGPGTVATKMAIFEHLFAKTYIKDFSLEVGEACFWNPSGSGRIGLGMPNSSNYYPYQSIFLRTLRLGDVAFADWLLSKNYNLKMLDGNDWWNWVHQLAKIPQPLLPMIQWVFNHRPQLPPCGYPFAISEPVGPETSLFHYIYFDRRSEPGAAECLKYLLNLSNPTPDHAIFCKPKNFIKFLLNTHGDGWERPCLPGEVLPHPAFRRTRILLSSIETIKLFDWLYDIFREQFDAVIAEYDIWTYVASFEGTPVLDWLYKKRAEIPIGNRWRFHHPRIDRKSLEDHRPVRISLVAAQWFIEHGFPYDKEELIQKLDMHSDEKYIYDEFVKNI